MIRHSVAPISHVLYSAMLAREMGDKKFSVNGCLMKAGSIRLIVFQNNIECVSCGIRGKYFGIERHENNVGYHANLYAIDGDGKEVLMTKDHIVPVSKGGKNHISNLQTMCTICNRDKGNRLP